MNSRLALIVVVLLVAAGAGYYFFSGSKHKTSGPPPSPESVLPKEFVAAMKAVKEKGGTAAAAKPSATASAAPVAAQATPTAQLTSNGRDKMHVTLQNSDKKPVHLSLKAGDIYANDKCQVVLLDSLEHDVAPGATFQGDVRTAAASLTGTSSDASCKKSSTDIPHMGDLITHAASQPKLSQAALQTAILALAANPSLDTFAKFPRLHGIPPDPTAPDFRVDVADIIAAASLLSEIGVTDRTFMADPQLELEAMLDPASHDAALHYYNIAADMEWSYWKHLLLQGDLSIRHYALFGIARYYPDVALVMLPKWAREQSLQPIYRLSAVRALGVTHRQEARTILHQLEQEFGPGTDLYQSADRASKYLDAQFNQS